MKATKQKKKKILRVSHSQLQTYKNCRREYHHGYNERMERRSSYAPFVFGTAMHQALEIFYEKRGKNCSKAMMLEVAQVFDEVDQSAMTPEKVADLLADKAKCQGIIEVYPKVYENDFIEFKEFIIESHFELDFGYHAGFDLRYQGFLDGLFLDESGDWWVFETKTKKYNKPEAPELADYIRRVHIDNQVVGYMWGAKQILTLKLGVETWPKGVIYNVIQKPSISKKKSETSSDFRKRVKEEYTVNAQSKEYFMRIPLQLKQSLVDGWWEEMKMWLIELSMAKATKKKSRFPMNSGACTSKYGTCHWLDACVNGKYKELLYRKKEKQYINPRLKRIQVRDGNEKA